MALVFLPWIRLGAGALNTTHSKQDVDKNGNITVSNTVRLNIEIKADVKNKEGILQKAVKKSFTLKGPGEVLGFSDKVVSLTEPVANENAFSPNQIPYVEFLDADFPWRYSIDEPDAQNHLKPWLVLIVLARDEFKELPPNKVCRIISVNTGYLPNLNDSWAFGHAQISKLPDFDKSKIQEYIRNHPECTSSRLLCPRRLQASKSYAAFLVPSYKMGYNAAMDVDVAETPELAWGSGNSKDLQLPYYYRWDFSTSECGDFEELAGKITVFDDENVTMGSRRVADSNGNEMEFDGMVLPFDKVPADKTYNVAFAKNSITQFNKIFSSQRLEVTAQSPDPELFLPLYGQNHFDSASLVEPNAAGTWDNIRTTDVWFSETNLDRNHRYAASLGASVVRSNQDYFVSRCFEHAGEVKEVNKLIKRYKALKNIRENILIRHINTMDDTKFMLVSKKLQRQYVRAARKKRRGGIARNTITGEMKIVDKAAQVNVPERLSFRNISVNLLRNIGICNSLGELRNERLLNFKSEAEKNDFFENAQDFKQTILENDALKGILNKMVSGPEGTEVGDSEIYLRPKLDENLLEYIPQQTLAALLPGLSELPNNKSILLKVNRKFLEAFMLGANHEMIRELIWREFPIWRRATVFNYFWGSSASNMSDIKDITEWQGRLGENRANTDAAQENIIVAIKSDLFRRYPRINLYAVEYDSNIVAGGNWSPVINTVKQGADQTGTKLHKPLFTVNVMQDLIFIYYNLTKQYMDNAINGGLKKFCFVVLENVSIPKFGLDECIRARKESLNDIAWGDFDLVPGSDYLNISTLAGKLAAMDFQGNAVNRDFHDAAKLALVTLNKPVGVIMDFSQIIK